MIRIAKTENGMVRGLPSSDVRITVYKGIPYAAPPVGQNRWRAPQKCSDWDGIRDAFEYGPIAVQDTPGLGDDVYCKEWHVDPNIPMSEDCLYLNIWTPVKSQDEKLPVLVFIHGGAFQWGYAAEMEFEGERIAKRGIVVVTIGYRLAALGFMAHPDISRENPEAPANFGCLDQQAAIKWVRRNISAFGGDPDNISIGGQSAGGASVLTQITCEDNYDDIKSAAIFSGIIRNPYMIDKFFTPGDLKEAEKKGVEFLKYLNVDSIEEARKLDAIYIRDKYAEYAKDNIRMSICIDGKFCKGEPLTRFANNKCADIPVFVGNTTDEFISSIPAESVDELKECVKEIFGDFDKRFFDFKENSEKGSDGYAPISALEATIKAVLEMKAEKGCSSNSYYYKFDADIPGEDNPGTFHSVDLWFFFETLAKSFRPFVGHHYDLARQMCNYWTNFIKTGNPNGKDADGSEMTKWKPYTKEERNEVIFTKDGVTADVDECLRTRYFSDWTKKRLDGGCN